MTIREIASSLCKITGVYLQPSQYGRLGKIIKIYDNNLIYDALEELKNDTYFFDIVHKGMEPLNYFQRKLSIKKNKENVQSVLTGVLQSSFLE